MDKKHPRATKRTKAARSTALLMRSNGATMAEMSRCADWQPHSVRGFLSGTLKKKLGLTMSRKREDDKPRRYFITRGAR